MAVRKTQALSLLEGILDETAAEAEAARQALDAELRRKDELAKASAEAAENQRRAEIARRLREEEDRQHAAADRRTATLEAMRVEELKAKGLWQEPEPDPAPVVVAAPQVEVTPMPVQTRRFRPLAAAAALLLTGAAAGGGYAYASQEFVDATTAFTSVQPVMVALAEVRTPVEFRAIPVPVVVAAPVEERRPRPPREPEARPDRPRVEPDSGPRHLPLDLDNLRPR